MSQPNKRKRERWLSGRMRGFPTWFLIDLSQCVSAERDIGEMAIALRDRRNQLERELASIVEAQERVRGQNMLRLHRNARWREFREARMRRANEGR